MDAAAHASKTTVSGKSRLPSKYWLALLSIPVIGAFAFAVFQPIQVLPRITLAPGFSFVDQNGKRLTSDDLRGKLTFYTFMYTGCEAPCPQTVEGLKVIESVANQVDTADLPVEFVAISFDPERDTPERLAQFAQDHAAISDRWHFVTGEPRQLKNVIGGSFGAYYNQLDDGSFEFTPLYVLVDGWGIRRAVYRSPMPDPAIIERDLTLLAKEYVNRDSLNRVAYEAAHLFLCYPD